jgi:hypothetical protein
MLSNKINNDVVLNAVDDAKKSLDDFLNTNIEIPYVIEKTPSGVLGSYQMGTDFIVLSENLVNDNINYSYLYNNSNKFNLLNFNPFYFNTISSYDKIKEVAIHEGAHLYFDKNYMNKVLNILNLLMELYNKKITMMILQK